MAAPAENPRISQMHDDGQRRLCCDRLAQKRLTYFFAADPTPRCSSLTSPPRPALLPPRQRSAASVLHEMPV